jgi:hypothetical protein
MRMQRNNLFFYPQNIFPKKNLIKIASLALTRLLIVKRIEAPQITISDYSRQNHLSS